MASLRKAIDAKCKECIYDPSQNGTWRQQVQACTSSGCPLFRDRPLPIAKDSPKLAEKQTVLAQNDEQPIPEDESGNNEGYTRLISTKGGE